MSSVAQDVRRRIETRTVRVGVVGLGYVGRVRPQRLAQALYASSIQTVVPVSSPRVAEMVKLLRESPSLDVMGLLHAQGAQVTDTDPFVPSLSARAWRGGDDLTSVSLDTVPLASFDCVAILTDHSAIDYAAIAEGATLVVDSRNAVKRKHPHVFRLGAPATPASHAVTETAEEAA